MTNYTITQTQPPKCENIYISAVEINTLKQINPTSKSARLKMFNAINTSAE